MMSVSLRGGESSGLDFTDTDKNAPIRDEISGVTLFLHRVLNTALPSSHDPA